MGSLMLCEHAQGSPVPICLPAITQLAPCVPRNTQHREPPTHQAALHAPTTQLHVCAQALGISPARLVTARAHHRSAVKMFNGKEQPPHHVAL